MKGAKKHGTQVGNWLTAEQGRALLSIFDWVAEAVAIWLREAGVTEGAVFRAINKAGRVAPDGFSPEVIWGVVKQATARCGMSNVAPHDLRRTCARLCHQAGGELEQIQFLLGHVSVQTTERY